MRLPSVRFGVDRLLAEPALREGWQRVGFVTNDAARLAADPAQRSRVALQRVGVPLVRLFGPEHGLGAVAADGHAVGDGLDPHTGLPVCSLYGARMRPSRGQLHDLDVVLFDVPDVGARFYTYAWTLYHLLHACADATVPLVVLDRPNPLGGMLSSVEGPLLHDDCRSFIGEDDIPVRHGLTLGELARLWQQEHVPAVNLTVVTCDGWDPSLAWPATGCAWVPTSPAMPSFDSAIWYTGTCLFEATNLSVGRGTPAPFTLVGAPWLSAGRVIDAVGAYGQQPVALRACTFTPTSGPYEGQTCHGVQLSLSAPHREGVNQIAATVAHDVRPVTLGLQLLHAVMATHRDAFAWARYPTAANPEGDDHFARIIGDREIAPELMSLLSAPRDACIGQFAHWTGAPRWSGRVLPVLLYPRT